jgi:hypothetical protein
VNPESIDLTPPALKPDCPNYVRNAQAVKKASDALQECLNQQAYFLVYLVEECLGGAHNLRKPIADSCGDETADYVISRYLQLQSEHKAVSEQFLAAVQGKVTVTGAVQASPPREHWPRFYRDELAYDLTENPPVRVRVSDPREDEHGNETYIVCQLLEDGRDDDDRCYFIHASELSRTPAPPEFPEWTDADSDAAQKQGWDIFTLTPGEGRHRQWEIEGLTEWPEKLGYPTDYLPPFYEDDPAAAYHVQAKAKLHQDPLAIRAIEFLVARGQRDVETFKLWEALPDGSPYKPKFRLGET